MKDIDEFYNELVEFTFELEEECEEKSFELVGHIIQLMIFDAKLLKSYEVSTRLDTLIETKETAITTIEIIRLMAEEAYHNNNFEDLFSYYIDALEISNLLCDYDIYYAMLIDYQLCIKEDNLNILAFNTRCESLDDYTRVMLNHFDNVKREKQNIDISMAGRMKLVKKDRKIVRKGSKYLKKIKK